MVINLLEAYLPFIGLIIFGNIENLILASQGVVQGVDVKVLSILSIIAVIIWLIIGTVATEVAIQYANHISFIGGLAIFILGIQAILGAVKNIKAKKVVKYMVNLKDYAPFTGLLIFGNIENLILASQGAVAHVDPFILGGLSLIAVVIWLLLGIYGTKIAIKYADYIEIFGGVAIILLGMQSMIEAMGVTLFP